MSEQWDNDFDEACRRGLAGEMRAASFANGAEYGRKAERDREALWLREFAEKQSLTSAVRFVVWTRVTDLERNRLPPHPASTDGTENTDQDDAR